MLKVIHLLAATVLAVSTVSAGAEKAIVDSVLVGAPVQDVWTAWTTTEGVTTFFAPEARVELRVDGPFELYMNPYGEPGTRGSEGMRILAFQENAMLAFSMLF